MNGIPIFFVLYSALLLPCGQNNHPAADEAPPVWEVKERTFKIPVLVPHWRKPKLHRLHLHYSRDGGATWTRYQSITPNENSFVFQAKSAGMYWFSVQLKMRDGTVDPVRLEPNMTVLVVD